MFYVSINGNVIRKNIVAQTQEPPIRIATKKNDKNPRYAFEIKTGPGRLVYTPKERILACGARLVLETSEVEIIR